MKGYDETDYLTPREQPTPTLGPHSFPSAHPLESKGETRVVFFRASLALPYPFPDLSLPSSRPGHKEGEKGEGGKLWLIIL